MDASCVAGNGVSSAAAAVEEMYGGRDANLLPLKTDAGVSPPVGRSRSSAALLLAEQTCG